MVKSYLQDFKNCQVQLSRKLYRPSDARGSYKHKEEILSSSGADVLPYKNTYSK